LLVVQYPSQRLTLGGDDGARLRKPSDSRGVIGNLQGSCGLLTQGLHLRIIDPKALDVLLQPAVLLGNLGKTVSQLALLNRNLAKQLKEFCDGLNTQLAGGGDDSSDPNHQLGAIACLGRCSKTHEFYDLFRRHAANRRDGAVANIAGGSNPATRGLHRSAANQLCRCRLCEQGEGHSDGKPRERAAY